MTTRGGHAFADRSHPPPHAAGDIRTPIRSDADIVTARQQGRALAARLGFSTSESTILATAISELARNILKFAVEGEVIIREVAWRQQPGVEVIALDHGPGIPDIELAMRDGYSSDAGLGLGLPGCKRLVDEFELRSIVGEGTTVVLRKFVAPYEKSF